MNGLKVPIKQRCKKRLFSSARCIYDIYDERMDFYYKDPPRPNHTTIKYRVPFSLAGYRLRQRQESNFVDLKLVKLRSGKGGDGKVSFLREAGRSKGPSDGGDGGEGGSIYIQGVAGETSLHKLKNSYKAENGSGGRPDQLTGKNGNNALIKVPLGSTIRWVPSTEQLMQGISEFETLAQLDYDSVQLSREFDPDGQGWLFKDKDAEYHAGKGYFEDVKAKDKYFDLLKRREETMQDLFPINGIDIVNETPRLLLAGGAGGQGNMHFQGQEIRNARFAKKGRYGIEETFLFELKLLADIGLVGLPNSGKSTLLRGISRARPKVGHWKFTTLNPTVGTITATIDSNPFSVADIPGIMLGAQENKGLGLDFLRHIERSKGLTFVVGLDSPDPVQDMKVLLNELGPKRLKNKKGLVVATKADLPDTEEKFSQLSEYIGGLPSYNIVPCCAPEGGNVEQVIAGMAKMVHG